MIIAYDQDWSPLEDSEQHALRRADELLPPSDTCIYFAFPWSTLFNAVRQNNTNKLNRMVRELKRLAPKNRPGQRVVSVCYDADLPDNLAYLRAAGLTDVFWVHGNNGIESADIRIHPFPNPDTNSIIQQLERDLFGEDHLTAAILQLFIANTLCKPGLCLSERLALEPENTPAEQKQYLQYLRSLLGIKSTGKEKPRIPPCLKVALLGEHSHRTPISYSDYSYPLASYIKVVEDIMEADVAISGSRADFVKNAKLIEKWQKKNKAARLLVVSEEPFWDMVWDKDFQHNTSKRQKKGVTLSFSRLNYVTSQVFEWQYLPYYITTDNAFITRYALLFKRNATYTAEDWLLRWQQSRYSLAFVAEKRQDQKYNVSFPELDMKNDMVFRTTLAERFQSVAFIEGKGWDPDKKTIRQQLPDWHLDKLTKLTGSVRLMSALENTHHKDYITEKLFDAFAVGGIPLYSANPDTHSVWRLVPRNSLLNLYGMTLDEAERAIKEFKPTLEYAKAYVQAQQKLAQLFNQPWLLWQERKRVSAEIARYL